MDSSSQFIASQKKEHLQYLKKKGPFSLEVNCDNLNKKEKELIRKWGHWFRALEEGTLQPFRESQERFIKVVKGELKPFTLEEQAWFKYVNRKKYLEKHPDMLRIKYKLDDDEFYNRDDAAKLRGRQLGTIHRTHSEGAQISH